MSDSAAIHFDFYGLTIAVQSGDDAILSDINCDFSFFACPPGEPAVMLEIGRERAPRLDLPKLKATLQTPRNIVYRDGNDAYVDYFGQALAYYSGGTGKWKIHCEDRDLAHEIAFLTILSRIGEHLDRIAMHRVHALGVEVGGGACLILLPMSGGKTTLALRLLEAEGISLLSEDSPLISREGRVYPFPLRIGVRLNNKPSGIPEQYQRTVQRMEFGPKTLIDIAYFRNRIGKSAPATAILLGERWLSGEPFIRPIHRRHAFKSFLTNCVVGVGLFQGVEYVLENSAWEILGKSGTALSRLRNSVSVIRSANVYRFGIGPDLDRNAEALLNFLSDSPFVVGR